MNRVLRTALRVLAGFLLWQVALRVAKKLFRFPVPHVMGRVLDSDFRRSVQPPAPIIARSGIEPGLSVLEVGCGSGAYTTFVARAVGAGGRVAALDIQPQMLAQLARKLNQPQHADLRNVTLHKGSAHALPFDEGTFDVVYTITALQEIPDPVRALAEMRRVAKPGGVVAVTEFLPDPDYVPVGVTRRQGEAAGLRFEGAPGSLWTYTARFRRPA